MVINIDGRVVSPSCASTVTIRCIDGTIEATGTSASASDNTVSWSNVCRASVSDFKLTSI